MLKVSAGEFRGRRLVEPGPDDASRPYVARVKEAVFNLLREWFDDASVLDLYAGVGTMGLEAISRGARVAVMVERSRATFRKLEENIRRLDCADRAIAVHGDATGSACLLRAEAPVDVVFADPPYALVRDEPSRAALLEHLARCREIMAARSFLVLRSPVEPGEDDFSIEAFEGPEVHRYARDMFVLLYMPRQTPGEDAP